MIPDPMQGLDDVLETLKRTGLCLVWLGLTCAFAYYQAPAFAVFTSLAALWHMYWVFAGPPDAKRGK